MVSSDLSVGGVWQRLVAAFAVCAGSDPGVVRSAPLWFVGKLGSKLEQMKPAQARVSAIRKIGATCSFTGDTPAWGFVPVRS